MLSGRGNFTRAALEAEGFSGFVTFDELRDGGIAHVPSSPGAYLVLREKDEVPTYLEESIGGWFKGKNPTVLTSVLEGKWISGCHVVYIGKAKSLKTRLGQYTKFGAGKAIGHYGGRYIWQLADSADFVVAWKTCARDETPAGMEAELIRRFKAEYGGLPFANIDDPSGAMI